MGHRSSPNNNGFRRNVLPATALVLVYFLAGKFGLSFFGLIHPSASAVWLPTGVAIAALLVLGYRSWPAIFIGAFLVNATTAGSILSSFGVAAGNTLEGVMAAYLVNRFAGGRNAFSRPADILKFACLAALLSTTVSATIGVASLTLGGYAAVQDLGGIWLTWWLGDAAGAMLVTPLLLLWYTDRAWGWAQPKIFEAALLLASIGIVGGVTFFHPAVAAYPLAFLCLAPLVWCALRFGPREVASAVALLAVIATAATATGHGSFVMQTPNESLLVLQVFMALIALTALPMAALTAERLGLLARERAARSQADAASRAKDEFLAILSHELRNPLAAISAAATVLDDSGHVESGEPLRWLRVIQRQTQHLARLIDDLLDIGRVTVEQDELAPRTAGSREGGRALRAGVHVGPVFCIPAGSSSRSRPRGSTPIPTAWHRSSTISSATRSNTRRRKGAFAWRCAVRGTKRFCVWRTKARGSAPSFCRRCSMHLGKASKCRRARPAVSVSGSRSCGD